MLKYEPITLNGKHFLNIWFPTFHQDREMTFKEKREALRILRCFENDIKRIMPEFQPCGWATWVEKDHGNVASLVEKLGAVKVEELSDRAWYAKTIGV